LTAPLQLPAKKEGEGKRGGEREKGKRRGEEGRKVAQTAISLSGGLVTTEGIHLLFGFLLRKEEEKRGGEEGREEGGGKQSKQSSGTDCRSRPTLRNEERTTLTGKEKGKRGKERHEEGERREKRGQATSRHNTTTT